MVEFFHIAVSLRLLGVRQSSWYLGVSTARELFISEETPRIREHLGYPVDENTSIRGSESEVESKDVGISVAK